MLLYWFAYVAPATAPSGLTVVETTGTSIVFQWNPLTTGVNGMIRRYEIICMTENGIIVMVSKDQTSVVDEII